MQEEIEHKTVNLAISTTKLSARTLLRGMQFLLRQLPVLYALKDFLIKRFGSLLEHTT